MPDPVTRKAHYDPNNFKVPDFRKDKDGNLDPTNFQAAVGLKDFMQRNNALFLNGDHHWEANNKGTVTFGDKVVKLNDQEKAMFKKLSDGLFNRLDAGANGTHDNVVGGKDIDKAIENSWSLHGDKTSPDGHWKNPDESVSITKQQAKERLFKAMEEGYGIQVEGEQWLHVNAIKRAVEEHKIINDRQAVIVNIDDPTLVHAFILLDKDFEKINTKNDMVITPEELKNWNV